MKSNQKHKKCSRSFTLIELLVVIAIIAILAGLLLPVLGKAKERGNEARCVSNMHQWGTALGLYCDDNSDYYPYDGVPGDPCNANNTNYNAWFNSLPVYMGEQSLCQLSQAGQWPTYKSGKNGLFICPSALKKSASVTSPVNTIYYYSLSVCLHEPGSTHVGYRRSSMTSPANTIVFCEEVEDTFPETHGQYCGARHFGGSNFVMGDGHVQWIAFKDFCRSANVNGPGGIVCPSPLGQLQWDQSGINGDWKNAVVYHWWPFIGANSAAGG